MSVHKTLPLPRIVNLSLKSYYLCRSLKNEGCLRLWEGGGCGVCFFISPPSTVGSNPVNLSTETDSHGQCEEMEVLKFHLRSNLHCRKGVSRTKSPSRSQGKGPGVSGDIQDNGRPSQGHLFSESARLHTRPTTLQTSSQSTWTRDGRRSLVQGHSPFM